MNSIETENQKILMSLAKKAYWKSTLLKSASSQEFDSVLKSLSLKLQLTEVETLKVLKKDYKYCSKHFFYKLKAISIPNKIGRLNGRPKDEYIKVVMWAHNRLPYAGHQHSIELENGDRWEVYCPLCRLSLNFIKVVTLPYWAFK